MKKQYKKYIAFCTAFTCILTGTFSLSTSAASMVTLSAYGDVNGDGSVNVFDIDRMNKHTGGSQQLSTKGKIYADLNADGIINNNDIEIIKDIILEENTDTISTYKLSWYARYGNAPVTSRYGDVNFDGYANVLDINLIYQYLKGEASLSPRQCVYADLNANGYVDAEDADIITYAYIGSNQTLVENSRDLWYHLYQPVLATIGDVDQNQQIGVEDAVFLLNYYAKRSAKLSVNNKTYFSIVAGDVNYDNIISVEDAVLVLTYYAKKSAGLSPTWE